MKPSATQVWWDESLNHFVRCKNLPFSIEEVKRVCSECRSCAEIKPRFFRKCDETLIKAIQPWQTISTDFKGLVKGRNNYLLIMIDECTRFPFVFPCRNMTRKVVIECLTRLFCLFGLPGFVHSDLGAYFMSRELKEYLTSRGVATSRTIPYHPTGNAQCERWNQTIWRTIKLMQGRNHFFISGGGQFHELSFDDVIVLIQPW